MSMQDGILIADGHQHRFEKSPDGEALLFVWKPVPGLSSDDFRAGIAAFAALCRQHSPARAVIDATALDQESPAVRWLRSQIKEDEDYQTWWLREAVPLYHAAGIESLAVGTGDPNAPGELPPMPGVKFAVAYVADVDAALAYRAGHASAA